MLIATGADSEVIEQIVKSIQNKLYEDISTQKIYKEAFQQLKNKSDSIEFSRAPTEHEISPDSDYSRLDTLQRHAFDYFLHETMCIPRSQGNIA